MFYTGIYHTMLMPVDRTGENPLWSDPEPYYDDFLCYLGHLPHLNSTYHTD